MVMMGSNIIGSLVWHSEDVFFVGRHLCFPSIFNYYFPSFVSGFYPV